MKKSSIEKIETIYVLQASPETPEILREINFKNMAEIASVRAAGYTDDNGKSYFYSAIATQVGRLYPIPQLKITRKSGGISWKNTNTVFTED
ncbi:MAG: hypothetical protein V1854_02790 [Methanobacteriota archaeon]